jgi:hypothetical protein
MALDLLGHQRRQEAAFSDNDLLDVELQTARGDAPPIAADLMRAVVEAQHELRELREEKESLEGEVSQLSGDLAEANRYIADLERG